MADYQKMYHTLFNEMTKAIHIMQNAQCNTEEIYINAQDAAVEIAEE